MIKMALIIVLAAAHSVPGALTLQPKCQEIAMPMVTHTHPESTCHRGVAKSAQVRERRVKEEGPAPRAGGSGEPLFLE